MLRRIKWGEDDDEENEDEEDSENEDAVNWMLNVNANILNFRFEFAEAQDTKIQAKYQNWFQAQNAKISIVSTPILTAKAAFLSIFCALSEKSLENGWKLQKT